MNWAEYERRMARLAQEVIKHKEADGWQLVGEAESGRSSTVMGRSGHDHQIDVQATFRDADGRLWLWIAECKLTDEVNAGLMACFVARVLDIWQEQYECYDDIDAHFITSRHYQPGAKKLADYYHIGVSLSNEYGTDLKIGPTASTIRTPPPAEAIASALPPTIIGEKE